MTSKTTGGVLLNIPVTASTNRMSGATYDVAGNVTQDGVHTFSYDPFGQPRKMSESGGQVMDAIYDADGERIGLVNEGSGDWKWTPRDLSGKVAREYLARNGSVSDPTQFLYVWKEDYAYRDGVLAGSMREFAEGGRRFFHLDHLGTPRVTTNVDGQVISQNDYYPFGQEITSMRQEIVQGYDRDEPMKFTGHERDFIGGTYVENTGSLDYMHAREHNAGLGRFLSVDPKFDPKETSATPQAWNPYSYVMNKPLILCDPTGETWRDAIKYAAEWALGIGQEHKVFVAPSNEVKDIQHAPQVGKARQFFLEKNATNLANKQPLQPVTNYKGKFGILGLVKAGTNSTQQFVGSFSVDIRPMPNGTVRYTVTNTTSFKSLMYGAAPDWNRTTMSPGGNVDQVYTWTEPAP